jgi:hypothetical protein
MRIWWCAFGIALAMGIASAWAALPSRSAQRLTIPEALAQAGHSLGRTVSVPSGAAPTVEQVLDRTDLIVRGIIGEGHSHLAPDSRNVLTDYEIQHPTILYQATTMAAQKPGATPSLTVTLQGGTIAVNGLTFTSEHAALPSLDPGTDCLLLLRLVDGRYMVAGPYFGAFLVKNASLEPITRKQLFAQEYRGMPAADAIALIVSKANQARRPR